MNRAFEIRLYPNKKQQKLLNSTFGCCRFIYNQMLSLQEIYYKEFELNFKDLCIHNILVNEYKWLKDVEARAIQESEQDLIIAYKNWFNSLSHKTKQKSKAPKFKKKTDKQSYRTLQMRKDLHKLVNTKTRKIMIPKIGEITYRTGYNFDGIDVNKVCNITLKKTKTNKYFCCICCDCKEPNYIEPKFKETAFDLGLKDFAIFDDGSVIENPKFLRKTQEKLSKEQRKLCHCVKDSKKYNKQKLKVAKLHEKIKNQRKDFQHKLSHRIVIENQNIYSENLRSSNMIKNHKLAKSIQDASFGQFCGFISYKSLMYKRNYVKIDSFYPSSKLCHHCGYKYTGLKLEERFWECPNCHKLLDRDENAALNILKEGQRIFKQTGQELPEEPVLSDNNSYLEGEATKPLGLKPLG